MLVLKGYDLSRKIFENSRLIIYRGQRHCDKKNVIVKTIATEYPTAKERHCLANEYELSQKIKTPYLLPVLSLERISHNYITIYEGFNGQLWHHYFSHHSFNIIQSLEIFKAAAEGFNFLHQTGIIHQHITPWNLLITNQAQRIKISGLCLAATQSASHAPKAVDFVPPEDMPYFSPELTGRTNRKIDARADIFSLGVCFYEALTKKKPFVATNNDDLLYAQIALTPENPHKINTEVPTIVSAIVMKCLAKNPEDRYQTMAGLSADLEHVLASQRDGNQNSRFELGAKDHYATFRLSEKHYGRQAEIEKLHDSFNQIINGASYPLIVIQGKPGIGKTSLIYELKKPLINTHGFFAQGISSPTIHGAPYGAVIEIMRSLTRQILTFPDPVLAAWRQNIINQIGENIPFLLELVSELRLIIEAKGDTIATTDNEYQHRFQQAILGYIKLFAAKEHPLILHFDNLQWADQSTQVLIRLLVQEAVPYCLLVAELSKDVTVKPRITYSLIKEWANDGLQVERISLGGLSENEITKLIADSFFADWDYCLKLAYLVWSKTGGNPFFIREFLTNLHQRGYIKYQEKWLWDLAKIKNADITDNVVSLILSRIDKLPSEILPLLKKAACFNQTINSNVLAKALNIEASTINDRLKAAVSQGIITMIDDIPRFSHQRMQKAFYELASKAERLENHYQLGNIMQENPEFREDEQGIFNIVEQLNRAISLINSQDEKDALAELNLRAGQKAKLSGAYQAAQDYFQTGLELLSSTAWQDNYGLALRLYTEYGSTCYLTGQHEAAAQNLLSVIVNAKDILDKIRVYELKISAYTMRNDPRAALTVGNEALRLLGLKTPKSKLLVFINIIFEYLKAYPWLYGKRFTQIAHSPMLSKATDMATARVLVACMDASYVSQQHYSLLFTLKLFNMSVLKGNSQYAVYAYMAFGSIACGILGQMKQGMLFGKLALKLLNIYQISALKAKIHFLYGALISHWISAYSEGRPLLLHAYQDGIASGDLSYASYSINHYLLFGFWQGKPLDKLLAEAKPYLAVAEKYKTLNTFQFYLVWFKIIRKLNAQATRGTKLETDKIQENRIYQDWKKSGEKTNIAHYLTGKIIECYFSNEGHSAFKLYQKNKPYSESMRGMSCYPMYFYFGALSAMAYYSEAPRSERYFLRRTVKTALKKFKKWAEQSPENYYPKYLILKAEQTSVIRNQFQVAATLYDHAIEASQKAQLLYDEAIANERCARHYFDNGFRRNGRSYLFEARYCYQKWGAHNKAKALEKEFASAFFSFQRSFNSSEDVNERSRPMDISAILKASRAISGEIVLDSLFAKLMRIIIRNSGAQRGFLLLVRDNEFQIAAEVDKKQQVNLRDMQTVDEHTPLALSIINYVKHTKENVLIHQAVNSAQFYHDPYIIKKSPKSIITIPIINQRKLIGLIYLENNLTTYAFTQAQVEILNILLSQAAISLENARLYAEQKQTETRLKRSNEDLEKFAYIVSHDLQEPLRMVNSFVQLLERKNREKLDEDSKEYMGFIIDGAQRMQRLIADLLEYSRLSTRAKPFEETDINTVIQDVLSNLGPQIEELQAAINCPQMPVIIGDSTQLQQLFQNLLSNALKFHGQDPPFINISVNRKENMWQFEVQDNGIGVPAEYADQIFEIFRRLHSREEYPGTGIGLATCKKIVERHGGQIRVRAQQPQGSIFYFSIAADLSGNGE